MKILLLILAGIVAVGLPQKARAAALPDCQSSFSYQGICMDTFGDSFGDPWHITIAMYCDVSGNYCSAKENIDSSWSLMTEGSCLGDWCRHAGASYDSALFGGYSFPMPGWVAPVVPPVTSVSAAAVNFSQLGEDVQYVGVGVIFLSLIVISFILVKRHLVGPETREERIERRFGDVATAFGVPFNYRDAWPIEQQQREGEARAEDMDREMGEKQYEAVANWLQDKDQSEAESISVADWEKEIRKARDMDVMRRDGELSGLDGIAGREADRAHVAAIQNAPSTVWDDKGRIVGGPVKVGSEQHNIVVQKRNGREYAHTEPVRWNENDEEVKAFNETGSSTGKNSAV